MSSSKSSSSERKQPRKNSSLNRYKHYELEGFEELDIKIATDYFKKLKHGDIVEIPDSHKATEYYYVYDVMHKDSKGVLTETRKLIRNDEDDILVPLEITHHLPDALSFYKKLELTSDMPFTLELSPTDALVQKFIKTYDPVVEPKLNKITKENFVSAHYFSGTGTITIRHMVKERLKKQQVRSQEFQVSMYRSK